MGLDLTVKPGDDFFSDVDTVNAYYDYIATKERDYDPAIRDQGPTANNRRQYAVARVEDGNDDTTVISERWPSALRGQTEIFINDLINSDDESAIYGGDIETFIERLCKGKNQIKRQDDPEFWEYYFELRLIALCEFALENDYGVVWN